MPTIEEIKALPKDEKAAILTALQEEDKVVEPVVEPIIEPVVEPIVEPIVPVVVKKDDENLEEIHVDSVEEKLEKAILLEMNDTNDREAAEKIVADHMSEQPDYYEKEEVVEKVVKPEVKEKSIEERFSALEKTFEEKTNQAMSEYDEKFNARLKILEDENTELRRTQPMGIVRPKPNEGMLHKAEERDSFSKKYKEKMGKQNLATK